MNPFSGFLQPMNNRPLEGLATSQDLLRVVQGNKEMKQRKLENEQQNTRADKRLSMEQAYQDRKFTQDDQKQVEALLAEYQDAEDQGDPVRLSRAAQMLKRFGMDVGQPQRPDLRAFTGESLLPEVSSPENLQDFTGEKKISNPIDEAVSTEVKSREALRARMGAPELSQEDFESQLIAGSGKLPERMEQDGNTTAEMRAALPQAPAESEKSVDMGDVDSPEFKQAAATEGGVVDLDQEDPSPLKIGGGQTEAIAVPRRLSSQLLPTVISKGGKKLYESSGPSGRWSPMVAGVFEPFTSHENPEIGAAAKRAQAMASKLIEVDGVAPKDAIKLGMDYLNGEASRTIALERTKLGTRPKWGGGGAGTIGKFQALGPKEDRAESIKLYITEARGAVGKLNESDRLLAQAEALASSSDPALQRNAIDVLVQSRSGATVSERERARYDQLDGVIASAKNTVSRWTGGPLDPSYVNKIKMVIAEQRRINAATREEVASDLEEAYAAQNEGKVDAPILQRRKAALGKTIRRAEDSGPSDTKEEDLY